MNRNLLLSVDSYKASQYVQYPPNTEYVYSYIESRGGNQWALFFGLQAFLKEYLTTPITMADIDEADDFFAVHGEPFNREGWEYILNEHAGFLPLSIKAVPEGLVIDTRNVLATVVNTDPKCFWLTSYMETAILRAIWYPTTVATNSFDCKLAILKALHESSDDPEGQIAFKLHDFGGRGVSSSESAALGGMAHLVNFMGSDTVEGILAARRYYDEPMAGFSIPAAEHSTITSWGKDHEVSAYRNMLKQFAKPGSIVAMPTDSYDLMHAVNNIWGETLKKEIIESGATVVNRPDSGNPLTIPVKVIDTLSKRFGYKMNSKGYMVLPSCVRALQGDGINKTTLPIILENLLAAGFSADNLAFGMGGGLLQMVNRDDLQFAMKCSAVCINGVWQDVFKDPKTDPAKASKRGRLALTKTDLGEFATVPLIGHENEDMLSEVFRDGVITKTQTFAEIRNRSNMIANILAKRE